MGYSLIKNKGQRWSALNKLTDAKIIIDIGAAAGTPQLYNAFRARKFILIEPQIEYKTALLKWVDQLDATVLMQGIDIKNSVRSFSVNNVNKELSSFQPRANNSIYNDIADHRNVECITLDTVTQQHSEIEDRLVLKIDVEGHELHVLHSGSETLKRTDLIIIEITFAAMYTEEYNYIDILQLLETNGFYLYDILDTAKDKSTGRIICADLIFRNKALL